MNDNNNKDEIDLISIFSTIKKAFSNLINKTYSLFQYSILHIKFLSIYILIGAATGYGLFKLSPIVYQSDLTLSHKRLTNGQCIDIIENLSKSSNKKEELSKKLNIDLNVANKIKNIYYKPLNNSSVNDSLLKLSDFKIEVKVYDKNILDSLQPKIISFLESNEYATKRKKMNRLYLDKLEDRIKNQIISIDSLRKIVDKSIIPKSLGNGIIMGESIDPIKVYQESLNLYQSQLRISNDKELNDSFEIVVGFSPAIPTSSTLNNMLLGGILGYLAGLIWLWRKVRT
jgi:hypothetical protein